MDACTVTVNGTEYQLRKELKPPRSESKVDTYRLRWRDRCIFIARDALEFWASEPGDRHRQAVAQALLDEVNRQH